MKKCRRHIQYIIYIQVKSNINKVGNEKHLDNDTLEKHGKHLNNGLLFKNSTQNTTNNIIQHTVSDDWQWKIIYS
jgi:hypothetical protein